MMPKIKCSQRRAIISLASGFSRSEKCGLHTGKVCARKSKNMESLRLQTQRATRGSPKTAREHRNGTPRADTAKEHRSGFRRAPSIYRRFRKGSFWSRINSAIDFRMRWPDRKSTRLNSSHMSISYAVFCLKKKKKITDDRGI